MSPVNDMMFVYLSEDGEMFSYSWDTIIPEGATVNMAAIHFDGGEYVGVSIDIPLDALRDTDARQQE